MSSEFERGRVAGVNEAVSRLALWKTCAPGDVRPHIVHAMDIVGDLLPPFAEPPADAEVAQAERAVIGAAMAWFCARVNDDHHEYLFFNRACAELLAAQDRQRSAAAKEQG